MEPQLSAPACYVEWMDQNRGFNPRAQRASNYLSECVLKDLIQLSPELEDQFEAESVKSQLNRAVGTQVYSRDVDLVIYDPTVVGPLGQASMTVENKTIMTAHGKARYNRQGDLIAYSNHVHNHNRQAVAGATMVINISSQYENPDKIPTKTRRRHLSVEYIQQTMGLYELLLRESPDEPNDQLEAIAIILVDYDGLHEPRLVTEAPALSLDNPYHYHNFCKRMVRFYEERFSS
jgi:hypothetical protein